MIAFAYAQTGPKLSALYRSLSDGLVENLREVFPGEQIALLTDEQTPVIKGVHHVMRIDRTVPLMTWRLKAHQMAHSLADEILFVEPDVRFRESVFPFPQADVVVTTREREVMLENEARNTPFTLGVTYSRSAEFWLEAKRVCQKLDEKDQNWFGDMLAIASVIDGGHFSVQMLDGAIYNHVINDPHEVVTAKAVHYKGNRKAWLFPSVREAA